MSAVEVEDPLSRLEIVRAAWCQVLELAELPDGDVTFFDAGGDSLRLVILVEQLSRRFGRPLRAADFLRRNTVPGHADVLGGV